MIRFSLRCCIQSSHCGSESVSFLDTRAETSYESRLRLGQKRVSLQASRGSLTWLAKAQGSASKRVVPPQQHGCV